MPQKQVARKHNKPPRNREIFTTVERYSIEVTTQYAIHHMANVFVDDILKNYDASQAQINTLAHGLNCVNYCLHSQVK